jgi:hypothetical protein
MTTLLSAGTSGIKVAIHFSDTHPIAMNEFFGWDGNYSAMMNKHNTYVHFDEAKKHLDYISERTQIDSDTGDTMDDLVVFMIDCPAAAFQQEYEKCVAFLNAIHEKPHFNDDESVIKNMKVDLDDNLIAFDKDISVGELYALYNQKICPFQYNLNYLEKANKLLTPYYQAA